MPSLKNNCNTFTSVYNWRFSANGVSFQTSSVSDEVECEIEEQDVVSFRFKNFSADTGKPIQPEIYRIRSELKWEDVVAKQKRQTAGKFNFVVILW